MHLVLHRVALLETLIQWFYLFVVSRHNGRVGRPGSCVLVVFGSVTVCICDVLVLSRHCRVTESVGGKGPAGARGVLTRRRLIGLGQTKPAQPSPAYPSLAHPSLA